MLDGVAEMPVKIFISYSYADEQLEKNIESLLSSMRLQGLIDVWTSRRIMPGVNWEQETSEQIDSADIILLLISADFLASDYAYSAEMVRIIEMHESRRVRVIPIILRPVDIRGTPFSKLQFLPRNARPVTEWPNQDRAFLDIATGIRSIIEDIAESNALPSSAPPSSEQAAKDIDGRVTIRPSVQYQLTEVFVLSGPPEVTFVAPDDFVFLKLALEQLGRGVVVEGPSGVGKTTSVEKAVRDLRSTKLRTTLPIQDILTARNPEHRKALQTLRKWHNGIVIVDDFHRLDRQIRQDLVDYLKELADTASKTKKLAIVGIPHTGQSLVNMSFDIATRLDFFRMDRVKDGLILQMIEKGEEALNIRFDRKAEIATAANNSFNLAQFLCYTLCVIAGITQTQEQTRIISCDIDVATERVMTYLEKKFEEPIKRFIAMGGPRDVTGLRLIEELAITEDGFLSLSSLKETKPNLAQNINHFINEQWIEKFYEACPDCTSHLFYDQVGKALVIDDAQLTFYLKKVLCWLLIISVRSIGPFRASSHASRGLLIPYL
jgi:hypothetical protein